MRPYVKKTDYQSLFGKAGLPPQKKEPLNLMYNNEGGTQIAKDRFKEFLKGLEAGQLTGAMIVMNHLSKNYDHVNSLFALNLIREASQKKIKRLV